MSGDAEYDLPKIEPARWSWWQEWGSAVIVGTLVVVGFGLFWAGSARTRNVATAAEATEATLALVLDASTGPGRLRAYCEPRTGNRIYTFDDSLWVIEGGCAPMTVFICGGGPYTHLVKAKCCWCCLGDDREVHAFREVFGGYEEPDLICGACGQGPAEKPTEEQRDENVALVKRMGESGIKVTDWPLPSALAGEGG